MALKDQIGTFAWFSLMTHDTDKATSFYKDLLGWTTTDYEIPGHGKSTIYVAGDKNFGNPVPLGEDGKNIPAHWISYVAVEDVDSSCNSITRMGGKVCVPAFDIPTIGRTAVVSDPVGGTFHIYTPENKDDDLRMTGDEKGQICWLELMVDEPEKVIPFYAEQFNWKIGEPMPMNGGAYYSIEICGVKLGGIMKRPPEAAEIPPLWMPYMAITNIDETIEQAKKLGAKIHMPKQEIPETGYFSLIEDPAGAFFYAFEYNMPGK